MTGRERRRDKASRGWRRSMRSTYPNKSTNDDGVQNAKPALKRYLSGEITNDR